MNMTIDNTTEPTTATAEPATPKLAKTATVNLTANRATMAIVAERKADGSAKTYVITTDADKKSTRGLTESHATFEAAKKHTDKLAGQAAKLGWKRREPRGGFVAKADAFTTMPPAPAAPKAKK